MDWPTLQMPGWLETRATLHLLTQIVAGAGRVDDDVHG